MNIRPLILFLLLTASTSAGALEVLTSVRPLQLIVDEIMGPDATSDSLIDARESPHHFQLKPSQLRKLARADVVIWISDQFEIGLARLQNQLPAATDRLELAANIPASLLIEFEHRLDGHLWLSPVIVRETVTHIATLLGENKTAHADNYQRNALALRQKIDTWLEKSRPQLDAASPAYILDHAFLAYFERDLGLRNRGSLRNAHDHGSGIRHLSHLHHKLEDADARCLLVDRLPASRQARQVAREHGLEIRALPLLGEHQSIHSIVDLYQRISDTLLSCRSQHK